MRGRLAHGIDRSSGAQTSPGPRILLASPIQTLAVTEYLNLNSLSVASGRDSHNAAKRRAERGFGLVAYGQGDDIDAIVCSPQSVGRQSHAPVDEVVERRSSHHVTETLGEAGSRHARNASEFGQGPLPAWFGMHRCDSSRKAWIRQGAQPTRRFSAFSRHPQAENLQQHDLGKMFRHQCASRRSCLEFVCKLLQRPSQNGRLSGSIVNMEDGRQGIEKQRCVIALEGKATADQKEVAATIIGGDTVHRPVVNRWGLYRRQRQIGRKLEGTAPRQKETITGFDPLRLRSALDLHPARPTHDCVELDPLMRWKADRPIATRFKAGTDRAFGPQQRKNIGKRVQGNKSERSRRFSVFYNMERSPSSADLLFIDDNRRYA